MKLIVNSIAIALLTYLSAWIGWWQWDFVLIAALVAYLNNANGWSSLLSGILGVGGPWMGYAHWLNYHNQGLLADKMAGVLSLGSGFEMVLLTAAVGGLMGGLGALTGSMLRLNVQPPRRSFKRNRLLRPW